LRSQSKISLPSAVTALCVLPMVTCDMTLIKEALVEEYPATTSPAGVARADADRRKLASVSIFACASSTA